MVINKIIKKFHIFLGTDVINKDRTYITIINRIINTSAQ